MGAMTDYLEASLRTHIFRTGTFTKPAVLAVALFTAAPGEAGGGTEVAGGSYARVERDPSDSNWSAVSGTDGLTDNVAALTFPAPTGNWGVVTHAAILDAVSVGNMLLYAPLATAKTVNNLDPAPNFPIGALDVIFD